MYLQLRSCLEFAYTNLLAQIANDSLTAAVTIALEIYAFARDRVAAVVELI